MSIVYVKWVEIANGSTWLKSSEDCNVPNVQQYEAVGFVVSEDENTLVLGTMLKDSELVGNKLCILKPCITSRKDYSKTESYSSISEVVDAPLFGVGAKPIPLVTVVDKPKKASAVRDSRGRKSFLSKIDVADFMKKASAYSISELADQYKVSSQTITNSLKKLQANGVTDVPSDNMFQDVSNASTKTAALIADSNKLVEMATRMPLREIASYYGVSVYTVHRVLEKLGYKKVELNN